MPARAVRAIDVERMLGGNVEALLAEHR
jgi:hypothetical protein